jgi:Domain of unknown function (DUF397)
MGVDPALSIWSKSSYSSSSGGDCIEFSRIFAHIGIVPVRDSKDPQGPALAFSSAAWSSFVAAVKAGELPGT